MDRRRRLTDYRANALRDLGFTLRTLRRDAGFTVVAILTLTLAIGANIAVFAAVNTLLLRPLPCTPTPNGAANLPLTHPSS